jgi:hypothetical protein
MILELNEQMLTIQKQKKELDGLMAVMTNKKEEEELKNKKKINDMIEANQLIKLEN